MSADSDYQQTEFTVTFGVDQDKVCLEVPILDDQMDEGTEKFEIIITGTPPGVSAAQPERTVVSIIDDDGKFTRQLRCAHVYQLIVL